MKKQLVAIPTNTELLFIHKKDLLYFCGEGSYTNIYLQNGRKITISKHLKEIETTMDDEDFVRIHNSHLINIHHAISYMNSNANCVKMSNGEELSVSGHRKKKLMDYFIRL